MVSFSICLRAWRVIHLFAVLCIRAVPVPFQYLGDSRNKKCILTYFTAQSEIVGKWPKLDSNDSHERYKCAFLQEKKCLMVNLTLNITGLRTIGFANLISLQKKFARREEMP